MPPLHCASRLKRVASHRVCNKIRDDTAERVEGGTKLYITVATLPVCRANTTNDINLGARGEQPAP